MQANPQSTPPRPTRSTLDRVEEGLPPVNLSEVHELTRQIARLLALRPLLHRVEILLDDRTSLFVDGPAGRVASTSSSPVDCRVQIQPRHAGLLMQRTLDVRQAMVFGQMLVKGGSARSAVAFGDFLTGRKKVAQVEKITPPRPTRNWDRARDDLHRAGYALVERALEPEQLALLRRRVVEQAAGEREIGRAALGESSQRVWNLLNKGRVFHDVLLHPLIETFVPAHIGEHALLMGCVASIALPGNASSIMHYDQIVVQPAVEFPIGLNILWFLDDVSADNGGTRILPGSHVSGVVPEDLFDIEGTIAAEGPAGTALLLDSRVWHAVGHNITQHPRHVLVTYFNRSYMRTQENYSLSLLPEVEASLDPRVRIMLGFRCTGSLGGVEGPVEGKMVNRPDAPIPELHPAASVE